MQIILFFIKPKLHLVHYCSPVLALPRLLGLFAHRRRRQRKEKEVPFWQSCLIHRMGGLSFVWNQPGLRQEFFTDANVIIYKGKTTL